MNRHNRTLRTLSIGLLAIALVAGILSSCAAPTPDPAAIARSLVAIYATQTAQAQAAPPATNPPPSTPTPLAPAPPTAQPPTLPPTASPTATTQRPSPTATLTPKPAVTPTPTMTAPPLPACTIAIDPALAPAWQLAQLGCPQEASAVIWAAWESFERGTMFWRSDVDWTYVLHWQNGTNASLGDWVTGGNAWRWDNVSFPNGHGLTPPPGRLEPIRGFGYVWYSFLGGQSGAIGWATEQEKGFCVTLQPFANGVIFRSNSVPYCQDQLFNWASDPSFAPIFVTLYTDKSWQRW